MEDASDYTAPAAPSEPNDVVEAPPEPTEPAAPIFNRFLYVDVAALRAKQLRRGARLRYDMDPGVPAPKKPERQAMEEVRRCLVHYSVPVWKGVGKSDEDASE
ncbi:MAG: DNA-directed RNA polymerase subunit omega [Acidobacteria bacterium]|nr:DNA-directed RNA polymerase subunit omega [Acidobacteriota bacterium]